MPALITAPYNFLATSYRHPLVHHQLNRTGYEAHRDVPYDEFFSTRMLASEIVVEPVGDWGLTWETHTR